MTDVTYDSPETTPDPFLTWLSTGTTRRETVVLFSDQAGIAELQKLWAEQADIEKRLDAMDDGAGPRQVAIGERSPRRTLEAELAALEERIEEVEERVDASRSVWTIRPLRSEEIDEIDDALPKPIMPRPTQEQQSNDKAKKRFESLFTAWTKAASAVDVERILTKLAKAVVSVETPNGKLDGITVAHLQAMEQAEYGNQRITMLEQALTRASTLEKELSRPFSSSDSESTQE